MFSSNIVKAARELLNIETDLPLRLRNNKDYGFKPNVNDFSLFVFEQLWGSTALGFGGLGGQSITVANTYVFVPLEKRDDCYVYFGDKFAYKCKLTDAFKEDLANHNMKPVYQIETYFEEIDGGIENA